MAKQNHFCRFDQRRNIVSGNVDIKSRVLTKSILFYYFRKHRLRSVSIFTECTEVAKHADVDHNIHTVPYLRTDRFVLLLGIVE